MVGERLGINARFSTSLDNGGASQILAVVLAVMAIEAGLATTVVCGYGRDTWSRTHRSKEARRRATRPGPAAQLPQRVRPRIRLFRRGRRARLRRARGTCIEYGTTRDAVRARSPWPSASTRCAIPKRR